MLDIIRRLKKFINIWSSIDLIDRLEVCSRVAAAVSRVHLRSEKTPWRPLFVHRIAVGKRHPGPCRTPTWTVYVFAIHCKDIIGLDQYDSLA